MFLFEYNFATYDNCILNLIFIYIISCIYQENITTTSIVSFHFKFLSALNTHIDDLSKPQDNQSI